MSLLIIALLLSGSCIASATHNSNRRHRTQIYHPILSSIGIKDKIIELQCYPKCDHRADMHYCREQCRLELMRSPRRGHCPYVHNIIFKNIPPLQKLSCLDNCNYDFDCPEVQKCCSSTCGPVCMDTIGVQDDLQLPPIPKILRYKLPRGHKVELTIQSSANSTYYCHVEARYHIGSLFSPRKMGPWQWQPVEKVAEILVAGSKRTDISFNIRPGRWYQVRVAAINALGFRGYSETSKAFTLASTPKPPKAPTDLQVTSAAFNGRHVRVGIAWCPAKSNLPVEKYKIIWSLYFKAKDVSLITNEAYVKEAHQYEITNLLPESSYYIQVQAMSISGSKRLKSEKRSILYNTTLSTLGTNPQELSCSPATTNCGNKLLEFSTTEKQYATDGNHNLSLKVAPNAPPSYEVRFRLNRKFGMMVQISGFEPHREDRVYELCPKDDNCKQREYSAIRVKKNSLEFSKLKYSTTYVLKALRQNLVDDDGSRDFIFKTPKCESFRKRFPKSQLTC